MAGTLFDNVAGSDQNITEEEVRKAIKLAYLKDEVNALPMGLQTCVMG
jgi:ABC-type bacteriocin/lantibiotic exporter with double-glycine peptidase domain